MGRNDEYRIDTADTDRYIENALYAFVEESVRTRKITSDEAGAIEDLIRDDIGNVLTAVYRRWQRDYMYGDEIVGMLGSVFTNICREAFTILDERDRRGRDRDRDRGRGRSGYSRDSYDRDRYDGRRDREDRRPSSRARSGYGNSNNRNFETDNERRTRMANEGNRRLNEQDQNMRYGRSAPKQEPVATSSSTVISPDIHHDKFSVINNTSDTTVELLTTQEATPKSTATTFSVDKAIKASCSSGEIVDIMYVTSRISVSNPTHLYTAMTREEPKLTNPENTAIVANYRKISVYPTEPGMGPELVSMSEAIKGKSLANLSGEAALDSLQLLLSDAHPWVRKIISSRVLKKWNHLARTRMCSVEHPNVSLICKTFENLMALVSTNGTIPTNMLDIHTEVCANYGGANEFNNVLTIAVKNLIGDLFGADCGFIDITEKNISLIAEFGSIPIVVGNGLKAHNSRVMSVDELTTYLGDFKKDFCCIGERQHAIFTDLDVSKFMSHPKLNCVTNTDTVEAAVLRNLVSSKHRSQSLFEVDSDGDPNYIAHVGGYPNKDLLLLKLTELD